MPNRLLARLALAARRHCLRAAERVTWLLCALVVAWSMAVGTAVAETTTTTLVTSNPATVYGQQFTLTATVTASGSGPASGTVTFKRWTFPIGSVTLNEYGQASIDISTFDAGTYPLTAHYLGNGELEASVSPVVSQVIEKAETVTTFTATPDPLNRCGTGQTVIFNVTVTAKPPGGGTPQGPVIFRTGDTQIFPSPPYLKNGSLSLVTNSLGEDVHKLTATYSAYQSAAFKESVSPVVTYKISNGPRTQVNTYRRNDQLRPAAAALTGGGFVVTWVSNMQDGSLQGIYGQLYDAADNPLGSEFRVNTYTAGNQLAPSVAGLANGGFVVTWYSQNQDGSGYGVYGQRYNAAGQKIGVEFRINTTTEFDQVKPSVAALADGGFVVVWISWFYTDAYVIARRFNAAGTPVSGEIKVYTSRTIQIEPDGSAKVIGLAGGGFVVVWLNEKILVERTIFAQRFSSTGSAVGTRIAIARLEESKELNSPDVAGLTDGSFVVSWNVRHAYPTADNPYSFGRRYTASGLPATGIFQINTTGNTYGPTVSGLADGGFVAIWMADRPIPIPDCGIFRAFIGQRFDPFARKVGTEFMVRGPRSYGSREQTVIGLRNAGFVVTWSDSERVFYPNYKGIFRRFYSN